MQFSSWSFWLFFTVVLGVYHAVSVQFRRWILLVASYLFYALIDLRFCLLLLFVTAVPFFAAARISKAKHHKGLIKTLAVSLNLAALAFFKYYDFFASELATLFGCRPNDWCLALALPVGISFYTFRGISYTLDVFRDKIPATKSWGNFALYMSFFPHLASGPIVRTSDFLPQVESRSRPSDEQLSRGVALVMLGLVKKLVFADNLAEVSILYFGDIAGHPGILAAWSGAVAYSFQLFFDFSGYTDMALGCGELLGFHFAQNFARPYLSVDIQEFWRRWHISLSTWLRDYLYISLGGNRAGKARTLGNLFLTMLLGGLWHGARWTFVVWGAIHGGMLVVDRLLRPSDRQKPPFWRKNGAIRFIATLVTFGCVCVSWVIFRADNLVDALSVLRNMVDFSFYGTSVLNSFHCILLGVSIVGMILEERFSLFDRFCRSSVAVRAAMLFTGIVILCFFRFSGPPVPFLYFKF